MQGGSSAKVTLDAINCKEFQDQSSESLHGGTIMRLGFAFSLDGARHFLNEAC